MLYREWCQRPQLRKGLMVKADALSVFMRGRDTGYCSVYLFNEADAKQIEASRSSKGLSQYEVHSDCVFIDIDTGDRDLRACTDRLRSMGLGYTVYSSGSKGYHVVVPLTDIVSGKDVPYSQFKWVQGLGMQFDPTVYRPNSLIALPGRLHPKTGIPKRLIETVDGAPLDLPIVVAPALNTRYEADSDALGRAITQLGMLVLNPPDEGGRHVSIWKTAKSMAEAGIAEDTTLDLLRVINESWETPKSEQGLIEAVRGAYG